jgi:hypothetical protein
MRKVDHGIMFMKEIRQGSIGEFQLTLKRRNPRHKDDACKFKKVTLKALANSSPGFALKPWVRNAARESSQP